MAAQVPQSPRLYFSLQALFSNHGRAGTCARGPAKDAEGAENSARHQLARHFETGRPLIRPQECHLRDVLNRNRRELLDLVSEDELETFAASTTVGVGWHCCTPVIWR